MKEIKLKYFKPHEFRCRCGCGKGFELMRETLLLKLDEAREEAGVPIYLSSAYRCKKHNKASRGVQTSSHLQGWAVDIHILDNSERYLIFKALLKVGFDRIGVGKFHLHVDADPFKPSRRIWYE